MLVRATILYILLTLCFQATAQTEKKDKIRVTEHKGYSVELPRLDLAQLRSNVADKVGAHQFAERRDVELTPSNSGKWNKKNNFWEWSLEIESPGAISLNLGFTEYELPESSTLLIYNSEGQKLGPFTKADNKDHLQLWTPILVGDKLILKLQVPEESMREVKLKLSAVNHGFAQPELRSGSCNVDVVCGDTGVFPMINDFEDQIRSVAVVQINGFLSCSGFLINSTQNDFQPYFLTAAHCAITDENAASTVFYWNYENSDCRPAGSDASGDFGDGLFTQSTRGASVVSTTPNTAGQDDVDFTFLLLDEPVDPDFRPYFAGWDIRPILPESTATIHHPNAEEKRISFDFDPPQFDFLRTQRLFVRVLNWEIGTTEPGSSGAPLFNQDGRAIGHLSGGIASCLDPSGFDQYGWIGMAWNNGNSAQTRLRDWLDPNNSGTEFIDGADGAFSVNVDQSFELLCGIQRNSIQRQITVDENFSGTVLLSLLDFPSEVNPSLEKIRLSPGETTTLVLDNLDLLPTGVYQVSLQASDGINQNTNEFSFEVVDNAPAAVIPESPVEDQTLAGSLAMFMWNSDANDFEIQISENLEFVNPIVQEFVSDIEQFTTSSLNESSEYFWRVRASNLCGQSVWSNPIRFRTASLNCSEIQTDDLAIQITEARNDLVEAQINIDLTGPIESVTVPLIAGTHSWSPDLRFSLVSPSGTQVILGDNLCAGNQFLDFNIGFSDAGFPISQLPCPFVDGRIYQPESPLSEFNGENPNGIWTLRVLDEFEFDGGFLESFHLEVCTASSGQLFTTFTETRFDACNTDQIESSFQVSSDFDDDVQISAFSTNENVTVSLENTVASPGENVNYTISNIDQLEDVNSSIRFVFESPRQSSESVILINFLSDLPDFDLLVPINNSVSEIGESIDFDWDDVPGATGYILEISFDDESFSDPFITELSADESSASLVLDSNSDPSSVFWRVIATGVDCNRISGISTFVTDINSDVNELGDLTITIFPNPFESDIRIEFSELVSEEFTLDLFSASGQRLKSNRIQQGSSQFNVDTSDVPPGIYFLRMQSELGVIVEKVVKQAN